ncbi:MAG: T9SS type A sorting domain-containing protein, partial [Cytophagales bacterium]|nr:T9SS type A sorting domain-containing protein [Cytophagales bacterium]
NDLWGDAWNPPVINFMSYSLNGPCKFDFSPSQIAAMQWVALYHAPSKVVAQNQTLVGTVNTSEDKSFLAFGNVQIGNQSTPFTSTANASLLISSEQGEITMENADIQGSSVWIGRYWIEMGYSLYCDDNFGNFGSVHHAVKDESFAREAEGPVSSNMDISLSPNPTRRYVKIETSNWVLSGSIANLIDINGKVLFTKHIAESKNSIDIELPILAEGLYYLQLINEDFVTVEPLIIE